MQRRTCVCLFLLVATPGIAQHRGGFGGGMSGPAFRGFGRGGFGSGGLGKGGFRGGVVIGGFGFPSQTFTNIGLPPVGPIPPLGANSFLPGFGRRFGYGRQFSYAGGLFPFAFPLFDGGYGYGAGYGYPPPANIWIAGPQSPPATVPQTSPSVAHPVIHTYNDWPAVGERPAPATGEQASLAIALNDGTRLSAIAVWVQDSAVHYVDSGNRYAQVALQSVDREMTRKLNQERGLTLPLPAP